MQGVATVRSWRLKRRPRGNLQPSDLEWVEEPGQQPGADEVLVRTLLLSLDPTNRIWMSDMDQYLPPIRIGDSLRGVTIGVVEASNSERWAPGDFVTPYEGAWATHQTLPAAKVARVRTRPDLPLSAHLSVLGSPGLTAYVGLLDVGGAKAGEVVTISAAAGAVGSVAGQIAKAHGCRVVGIAGGWEKCRRLTGEFGFDAAIDYKSEDVLSRLRELCPDGIDLHFENVGGSILDAAVANMRVGGRIALCGLIASYNGDGPVPGPREFQRVLMQRITVRGFIVLDHFSRARDAHAEIGSLIRDGRLKWRDHIVDGLENAPDALALLFSGGNDGKLMVRVSS